MSDEARRSVPAPDLSFVLATERPETIERVLASLRAQTARDRLEVVIVSLSGKPLAVDVAGLEGFAGHRLVQPASPLTLASGRAAGVLAATAPYIHLGETHSFPRPDWAERLLEALGNGASAVVSGLDNANPDGGLSWANLIVDYGPWLVYLPAGEASRMPAYNTAFERSFAHAVAERVEEAFTPGYDLAEVVRQENGRIAFQPAARIDHANLTAWRLWLWQRYASARTRAAVRSRNWSWTRRAMYALGSPLLPVLLAARLVPPFLATRRARTLPRLTLPLMLVGLVAIAAGEFGGFLAGASPRLVRKTDENELYKVRYTSLGDGR